jgi:hypothetical protein
MSIEAQVPKDIRVYKSKVLGPFTLRQVICLAVAIAVDCILYFGIFSVFNLSINFLVYAVIFVDLPIFAFTVEPLGLPMEQYLHKVLLKQLLAPTRRKIKTQMSTPVAIKMTDKEKKKHKKKLAKEFKAHPEMKPIK